MGSKNDAATVLLEDIDEEVLEQMPEWFRILKKAYRKHIENLI